MIIIQNVDWYSIWIDNSIRIRFQVGLHEAFLTIYVVLMQTAVQSFNHIHGKNGLTDIQPDQNDEHSNCFYTAGKDGRVGLWRLVPGTKLQLLSVINTSLGWISRLLWIDKDLIYLAFHSVNYSSSCVWNAARCVPELNSSFFLKYFVSNKHNLNNCIC